MDYPTSKMPTYNLVFNKGVYNSEKKLKAKHKESKNGKTEEVHDIPDVTAVYCLLSTNPKPQGEGRTWGRLLYIGKTSAAGESTTGFRTRCLQHLDPKRKDYLHNTVDNCPDCDCWYGYAEIDARSLDKCEAALIKCFGMPPLNKVAPSHLSPSKLCISGSAVPSSMHGTIVVPADKEE